MVVVTEDIVDILLCHSNSTRNYNIDRTPYAETYRTIQPAIDYIKESKTQQAIENAYNEKYAKDGVSIKHNDNNLKVEFSFIDEQHHAMFVLKYS